MIPTVLSSVLVLARDRLGSPMGGAKSGPLAAFLLLAAACNRPIAGATADAGADAAPAPAPESSAAASVAAPPDRPLLGITAFVATVYAEPRETSKKLGYLRVGAKVARSAEPAGTAGCPGGWYSIAPRGFVCAGKDATTDLDDPILRAGERRPDLGSALPYRYGFVRAVLPLYVRIPTAAEQYKSEFKLKEHLDWYKENEATVQGVTLGANDVAIDERGIPIGDKKLGELGLRKNSLELGLGVLFGGQTADDPPPFWLEGGKRLIPNISDFQIPDYAVFADRARRHTGLALVASFATGPESLGRRFAVTTDLRLAPTTKLKPDTGSPFHGVALGDDFTLPVAFVRTHGARAYKIHKGTVAPVGDVEHRSVHALAGTMKTVEGVKYYRTKDKRWLGQLDVGLAVPPASWPADAEAGKKWIEISIENQTLVLWEGKKPVYVTLVSSGKAGLDDPKKTTATVRGVFRIRNKHITATMDSDESSAVGGRADTTAFASTAAPRRDEPAPSRKGDKAKEAKPAAKAARAAGKSKPAADAASGKPRKGAGKASKGAKDDKAAKPAKDGKKPKDSKREAEKTSATKAKQDEKPDSPKLSEDYVPRRGDGVYGVSKRRGEGTFQLRDVPYIQYFASGYALHAAYWHDVFGTPRSHGCVNLSPVDAHYVFMWTDPPVPEGWHAINTGEELGEGTTVIVHE